MVSGLMQGTGSVSLWGFSKALDFQDSNGIFTEKNTTLLDIKSAIADETEPLDVLLIGASDPRHIIKTAGRAWKHSSRQIHFHVIEPQSSLLARHMLLLSILFDPLDDIGIQVSKAIVLGLVNLLVERAELFLECYGNLLIRKKTATWINAYTLPLIRAMTDGAGVLGKLIDFSGLKFRERDDIEFVFKFWRDQAKQFDAKSLWDIRLRRYYAARYDCRENAIDWDYHMNIRQMDKTVSIIFKPEFLRWRLHGTAFEVRESTYECANRSMATVDVLKQDGVNVAKWGYFSDILFGPYLAFGIDTENKEMLVTNNDSHKHTSQEISEYNVRSLIHELKTGTLYEEAETKKITCADTKILPDYNILDKIKVSFLPCDVSITLEKKRSKLAGKFKTIFISNAMAHRLADAAHVLHPQGEIIVETAKFMVELSKELRQSFEKKLDTIASSAGLVRKQFADCDANVEFMVFKKE
ncbi:hypothetical protein BATDEDRAFT_28431 [Batrachochytrium dendrobatidis JAM81]|uniref:Dynein assembly factor 3, axonemal n=1 Tax=Batrachochytrium dendrobatidis (strain JAM81 / FGSC 10211) TaxID=684364 RepID=F4PE39_BATDJ|nr:uncharacterized protein BATDEDRAFT_28431 [Batrachochytrium dendrobatidis JAM81]EGF76589.1 hypothetical protein BATDEDRAFT_28431 [Batrachochytrium dendrobatidis JAM81]|eukprot:XP_006682814.1 hypothetical protein BATDEDRAFT_28431 [Batrachochytrium dendrobatidis JAM81]